MNERFDNRPRSSWDVVQFGITFFGLLITAGGIASMSPPLTTIGFIMVGWGMGYFLIKQW